MWPIFIFPKEILILEIQCIELNQILLYLGTIPDLNMQNLAAYGRIQVNVFLPMSSSGVLPSPDNNKLNQSRKVILPFWIT